MGIFDGYLIISDIDGTLTNSDRIVSDKNINAINYFKKNGGIFTIATGRLINYLSENNLDKLINAPAILANGCVVYDYFSKKIVCIEYLNEFYKDVIDFLISKNDFHHADLCTLNGRYDIKNYNQIKSPLKIVICYENEENAIKRQLELRNKFGDIFDISRSWNTGVEVLNNNCTKGDAMQHIINYFDHINTCVAIGDYENDISLAEKSDIFFAPSNTIQELKTKADYIVSDHNQNAIYDMIKKLEKIAKKGTN